MKRRALLSVCLALTLLLSMSGFAVAQEGDIVDLAVASGDFTYLVAAVEAAGLVDTLKGDGPFTVFAPTDAAFEALPEGTFEALLVDPTSDLTQILLYHVLSDKVMAADVSDGLVAETLLPGRTVTFSVVDGAVKINGVAVVTADLEAGNGVIHVIDAVMIPPVEIAEVAATATPVAEEEPAATATPVAEEEPAATATPVAEEEPAATATPVAEEEPAATATPVAEEEPAATATPVAEEEPAATATPVAEEEPAATATPVAEEESAATATPEAEEEPAATATPVAEEEPAATATPVAEEEPAAPELMPDTGGNFGSSPLILVVVAAMTAGLAGGVWMSRRRR